MPNAVKEETLQGVLKFLASFQVATKVLILKHIALCLDIPDLHAADTHTQLATCGHLALASLGSLLLLVGFHTVLPGTHLKIQNARVRHSCREVLEKEKMLHSLIRLLLSLLRV